MINININFSRRPLVSFILVLVTVGSCIVYVAACDDSDTAVKEPPPDAGQTGPVDSGPPIGNDSGGGGIDGGDGGPKDCFDNSKTHLEIINACTNAARITKNPTLTKLLPDGGLPPLN